MNAKQKLHQTLLAKWTALFQEQSMSGLTIREWCSQNNVPIHKFNYWKHVAKETYVDSVLPDIVPIAPSSPLVSCDTHKPDYLCQPVCVMIGDIRIEFPAAVPDDTISSVIKAVRHA